MRKLSVFLVITVIMSCCLFLGIENYNIGFNGNNDSYEMIDFDAMQALSNKYESITNNDANNEAMPGAVGDLDYVYQEDNPHTRETSFGRIQYFENLLDYSPMNTGYSCGYVSLIQAMSFYDTFYNDNIIPETYDRGAIDKTNETDVKAISPGVLRQNYSGDQSYYQFCHNTQEYDLQSRLTVERNIHFETDSDAVEEQDGELVPVFQQRIGGWDYQKVLDKFYKNYDISVFVNSYQGLSNENFIQLIKETIDTGNPIIVHIKKFDTSGKEVAFHSVVAYDYDNNGIYANFGWYRFNTRDLLLGGKNGYSLITDAFTLNYSANGHTHSNNYVISGRSYCGCNISDEINFANTVTWNNVPPTVYWMKDNLDANETYTISFRPYKNGADIVSYTTKFNQITIAIQDWQNILNQCNGEYYVRFKRNSTNTNYNPSTFMFFEPTGVMEHITLSPAEYGFEAQYFFYEKIKEIGQGTHTITTTRLRCGYIENEYIVLSPRRDGALTAYLAYEFNNCVYRIDVDLALWSANEFINQYNATAILQYKNGNGEWITCCDLLRDIVLSTDRNNPLKYSILFPEGTYEFRFYMTSVYGADRNKGRLCIGDMSIYLE